MKIKFIRLAIFVLIFAPWLAQADGNEVVVVYNSRMPESKYVAEHYAQARQVPAKQIFGFELSTNEEMSRAEFRDTLQIPLAKKLERSGLWEFGHTTIDGTNGQPKKTVEKVVVSKIRYAVLCYGVPLKIAEDPTIHETIGKLMQPELQRNQAAVDSELVWLPLSRMEFPLTGIVPNWLYCATNTAFFNPTNGFLTVARLDGPTADIAHDLVDKSLQAERDGLWGRAYFDARGLETNSTYYMGDQWMLGAAAISQALGFETTVDMKPETFPASFPMSHVALYAGWYDGAVSGPFTLPKVEFMPGAFAYHLYSFSAATVRSSTAFWCGPLLAKGATCTMGCVNEPYLSGTPNVAEFLNTFGSGFTFGEAAWASQPVLSWQTTVIGDPLYRPFGKTPQERHTELSKAHNPLDEWAYLQMADIGIARGARLPEISQIVENLDAATNSAVLTEKLADLYAAQGKPSSAILTYKRALKLKPSPEQRIRLRLTLGEKLQTQNRDIEAFANYEDLLAEAPDYPGRESISNMIATLRQKFSGTNGIAAH